MKYITLSLQGDLIDLDNEIQRESQHITVGFVPTKNMQTPPLSFDPTSMEDKQCAEPNEK